MRISIVIPAYNEEKRIGKTVEIVWRFFENLNYDFEIIVSDDGSTDKTIENLRTLKQKYQNLILLEGQHKGKGLTLKAGMEAATGDIVLFTDADMATPISEFAKLARIFEVGADVVIGSRGVRREGAPAIRWVMAWGLNLLAKIFLGLNLADTQCGFKAFRKQALTKILPRLRIYKEGKTIAGSRVTASFDLELLYLARKFKFKIREVRVLWEHKASKAVRPATESVITLVDIFKIRINNLLGKYSENAS